jgi:hypothetical protein
MPTLQKRLMNRASIAGMVGTTGLFLAGSVIAPYISQEISRNEDFFNIFEKKYSFGEEYTKSIDAILMKDERAQVNSVIIELGGTVPNYGVHYYYRFKTSEQNLVERYLYCLRFHKKREFIGDQVTVTYHCYVGLFNDVTYENVMSRIKSIDPDLIQTISIDTASHVPRLVYCKKICHPAHARQDIALDHISQLYHKDKNHNVKTIIFGARGTGKTYVGRLLKRRLEKKGMIAYLFDDFNPASVGVNIQYALNQASQKTPVIIIVDEINALYNEVTKEKQEFDTRLQYTRNKQSFNNMLDLIGDTKYVVAIYTTELSIEQLNENEDHKSFFRRGRVDFFLNMTEETCTLVQNI